MKAARTTRASETSDMRPPCHLARTKISTSPPLGFCPSGAAACYRGFRNARTGDGFAAIRNPSCHSVDQEVISLDSPHGQSEISPGEDGNLHCPGHETWGTGWSRENSHV